MVFHLQNVDVSLQPWWFMMGTKQCTENSRLWTWHLVLLNVYYLCYTGRCHWQALGAQYYILSTLVLRSWVFEEKLLWIPLPCLIVFFFFIMRQKINHRGKKWLHSCVGASWLQGIGRTGEGKNKSWTFGQRSSCTFFSFYNRLLNPCL